MITRIGNWSFMTVVVLLALSCEQNPTGPATPQPTKDPGKVDDELIQAIKGQRYEDAYLLMSTPYRNTVSHNTFKTAVSRNSYLKNSRGIGCWSVATNSQGSATVHVRECILKSNVGNTYAKLFYTIEDREWKMINGKVDASGRFKIQ